MKDIALSLIGKHRIKAYDYRTHRLKYDSGWLENLVTTVGKQLILNRLFGLSGPPASVNWLGVGTDTTAPALNQTQLNPVIPGSTYIQAFDAGTVLAGQVVSAQATYGTSVANFTIAEGAMFNGAVNGTATMLNRVNITPAFTKTSALVVVYQVTFTQT